MLHSDHTLNRLTPLLLDAQRRPAHNQRVSEGHNAIGTPHSPVIMHSQPRPFVVPRIRGGSGRVLTAASWLFVGAACGLNSAPGQDRVIDFRRDVYPILSERCFSCHAGADAESGRRLDLREELTGESTGVALVIPGDSRGSRLIDLVSGRDPKLVMPPEGPQLTDAQVGLLGRWIDTGLVWDDELLPPLPATSKHWAFQTVRRPHVPQLADDARSLNPVDCFIAARHRALQLTPAPEADRRTLVRRLSLDLLGLPPSATQVEAFDQDRRMDAYERLVDSLLASPHYGERWGRHWLDVARWAESEGFESNHPRPSAWRYRDYVVESFNQDRPYDEFVRQQIAGDELPKCSDENLIATGFLAAARISSNEEDKWLQRNDVNVDIVNAVGSAFLGLTLSCAQCHSHKFDPISLRDYYALQAFFVRGQPVDVRLTEPRNCAEYESLRPVEYEPMLALQEALFEAARQRMITEETGKLSPEERAVLQMPIAERTREQERLARQANLRFQKTPDGIRKYMSADDRKLYEQLNKRIEEIEQQTPAIPQTFAFYSPVTSPHNLEVLPSLGFYPLPFDPQYFAGMQPYLMARGDVHALGPRVVPGWPTVLGARERNAGPPGGGVERTRRDLADWLTEPDHPLVARVWVNRIWLAHFGRGLVATPDDFGLRGQPPSHPELLDWLAAELVDSGWSTRHIQRLIVTSRTYRQSGRTSAETVAADPDNELLTRWTPRRLDAEVLRDSMLAVAGMLDCRMGGSSVPIEEREASTRRALYHFQRRGRADDMLGLFDGPNECAASCAQRTSSTTPLQSLYLLNDPFWLRVCEALAGSLEEGSGPDDEAFVEAAFQTVLQRSPTKTDRAAALGLLRSIRNEAAGPSNASATEDGAQRPSARALLCQALLNLSEFAFLE
jgi:hypothetical protein